MAYTHQREIVQGITEVKREETRRSRIVKAIEMLKVTKKSVVPGPIDPVGKEEE